MNGKKVWILWDARARYGVDTDECSVMVTANRAGELADDSRSFAEIDSIWAEYDLVDGVAKNEKLLPEVHADILCVRKSSRRRA